MTPAAMRLLTGATDPELLHELRAALAAWITDDDSGPTLPRRLGLGTRSSARRDLRNAALVRAARRLDGGTWQRATALAERLRAFQVRRLPRWRRHGPPDDADPIDLALYEALDFGPIPETPRQLANLLAETDGAGNFGGDVGS